MKLSHISLAGIFLPLLGSCGGNVFHSVSLNQPHSVLKPEVTMATFIRSDDGTTSIIEIDGKKPSYWRFGDTFRVSPGEHAVGLLARQASTASLQVIRFKAEQGKTYIARSDQAGGLKMKFWIEESDSKKVVANAEGPMQFMPQSTYTPIFIPISN